jgi:alkylhydroperoxidase family enzyme
VINTQDWQGSSLSLLGTEGESFIDALALRPALQTKYAAFLDAIESSDSVPERVFRLCRARIAQIHGQQPEGISADEASVLQSQQLDAFDSSEKTALAAAEKMPFQHHFLEDEEVEAIKLAFGDAGCVSLLTALAFFDVSCRLNATMTGGVS